MLNETRSHGLRGSFISSSLIPISPTKKEIQCNWPELHNWVASVLLLSPPYIVFLQNPQTPTVVPSPPSEAVAPATWLPPFSSRLLLPHNLQIQCHLSGLLPKHLSFRNPPSSGSHVLFPSKCSCSQSFSPCSLVHPQAGQYPHGVVYSQLCGWPQPLP